MSWKKFVKAEGKSMDIWISGWVVENMGNFKDNLKIWVGQWVIKGVIKFVT
jgi:hypothetical protein